jgi:hypothetical protein
VILKGGKIGIRAVLGGGGIKFPVVGYSKTPIIKTVVRYVLKVQPKGVMILPKRQALGTLSFVVGTE